MKIIYITSTVVKEGRVCYACKTTIFEMNWCLKVYMNDGVVAFRYVHDNDICLHKLYQMLGVPHDEFLASRPT